MRHSARIGAVDAYRVCLKVALASLLQASCALVERLGGMLVATPTAGFKAKGPVIAAPRRLFGVMSESS